MGMAERMLVILRHAKAERPAGVADEDRPLTQRGHADAAAAGAWLDARGYRPDLVLCSPSKRTRQTWRGVAVALASGAEPEVRYDAELYYGSAAEALALVREIPAEVGTILLVGHNPGVSLLSALLDHAGRDGDGLRTCGIAVHRRKGAWADFGPGAAPVTETETARARA
jgi:phosphohistidine phosphatase